MLTFCEIAAWSTDIQLHIAGGYASIPKVDSEKRHDANVYTSFECMKFAPSDII